MIYSSVSVYCLALLRHRNYMWSINLSGISPNFLFELSRSNDTYYYNTRVLTSMNNSDRHSCVPSSLRILVPAYCLLNVTSCVHAATHTSLPEDVGFYCFSSNTNKMCYNYNGSILGFVTFKNVYNYGAIRFRGRDDLPTAKTIDTSNSIVRPRSVSAHYCNITNMCITIMRCV